MKIALEVKNNSKIIRPSKNNVIIYDGKEWYVTTKEELFGEYEKRIDSKCEKLQGLVNELKEENKNFKNTISKQMVDISNIVESMYKNQ